MMTALAVRRNEFVTVIADEVFVAHGAPSSKTEVFCQALFAEERTVRTFDRK